MHVAKTQYVGILMGDVHVYIHTHIQYYEYIMWLFF